MTTALLVKWWWKFFSTYVYPWGPLIEGLYYTRRRPLKEGASFKSYSQWWWSVLVSTSAFIGLIFMIIVLVERRQLPKFFTVVPELIRETSKSGYLLGATIFLNFVQPVLSGVAIGAGWQSLVAFTNIGCYYLVGLPLGAIFGFKLKLNALGIWVRMLVGTLLQTVILVVIPFRTKWQKEAMLAEERIRVWGGHIEFQPNPEKKKKLVQI